MNAVITGLLIPFIGTSAGAAIEQSSSMGQLAFLPAFIGFWLGILFVLLLDHVIPHLHRSFDQVEGSESMLPRAGAKRNPSGSASSPARSSSFSAH